MGYLISSCTLKQGAAVGVQWYTESIRKLHKDGTKLPLTTLHSCHKTLWGSYKTSAPGVWGAKAARIVVLSPLGSMLQIWRWLGAGRKRFRSRHPGSSGG